MIPCEFDRTSTPFYDKTILTYEIELPPAGNKIGFHLLDYEYFTIPYVTDKIPNLTDDHQLTTQAKKNLCIIYINGDRPITDQGALDEINIHQTQRGKYKVNISLCRRKSYQRTDSEDICYRFDKVRPVV